MVRNRTTVKLQPGLFLQPYVVDQLVGQIMVRVVGPAGISGNEFAVTSWLRLTGPVTPTALAADLGMSPTTLSAMIDRLVKKGLLRRVRNPDDGRSYRLELTDAGNETNADCAARFDAEMQAVRANLAGDPEEILAGMRLLEAALRMTLGQENGAS